MKRVAAAVVGTGLALLGAAGCGPAPSATGAGPDEVITVFAAASLTEAFTALGAELERTRPGTRVRFSFGPSSGLAEQIAQGAPADVFASAGPAPMRRLVGSGDVSDPTAFATNQLQIAVPPGNPARITRVADLARPGLKVALCQPQVPCGQAAAEVLAKADARVVPATEEVDVKAVLAKVRLAEVDAGIVYRTDLRSADGAVQGVPIPAADNASTTYSLAPVTGASHEVAARAFVRLVRSAPGRARFASAGFGPP